MTKDRDIKTAVPPLRFPEFENIGEWRAKMLENILDNQSSQIALNKLQFIDDGYPVYGADGLAGFISDYTQEDDYIAIVKDGSGVGRLTLHKGRSSVLGTLNCLTSKDKDEYILTWLYYLLQTINFSSYVKGSGIPHIYYSDYKNHIVYLPNPKEQTKIADCLSSLDDLISAVAKKIEALKLHKKGLMQQLFPAEGLTIPTLRFPEFNNAGEWKKTTLGEVTAKIGDGIHGTPQYVNNSQYYFVNGNNFINGQIVISSNTKCVSEDEYKCHKKDLDDNTILMSINGTIGNIAKYNDEKVVLGKSAAYLKFEDNISFFYQILQSPLMISYFESELSGSTIKNLSLKSIREATILIPAKDEQQKIADSLSLIDNLVLSEVQKLDQLKVHKEGLLQQLFPTI